MKPNNKVRKVLYASSLLFIIIGMVLTCYGFVNGARIHLGVKKYGIFTISEWRASESNYDNASYKVDNNVKTIRISSDMTDVEIRKGTEFSVRTVKIDEKALKITQDNGDVIIDDMTSEHSINIGFDNGGPKIIVTLPDTVNLLDVNVSAGDIDVYGLSITNINLETKMGDIETNNVTSEELNANTASGDIDLNNVEASIIDVKTNMGEIEFKGDFSKSMSLVTNLGDIDISLRGRFNDYSFIFNTDLGEISVYDHDKGSSYESHDNADRVLNAKTNSGDIDIE